MFNYKTFIFEVKLEKRNLLAKECRVSNQTASFWALHLINPERLQIIIFYQKQRISTNRGRQWASGTTYKTIIDNEQSSLNQSHSVKWHLPPPPPKEPLTQTSRVRVTVGGLRAPPPNSEFQSLGLFSQPEETTRESSIHMSTGSLACPHSHSAPRWAFSVKSKQGCAVFRQARATAAGWWLTCTANSPSVSFKGS